MILTITQAGLARETDALTTGDMPKFDKIVIGSGVPHTTPFLATAMVTPAYETQVIVVERLSAGAVKFHASIPSDIEVNIREIGLFLEDGTLYAYAPFTSSMASEFFKPVGYAFSISVSVARQAMPPITVNYDPLDTQTISDNITAQTLSQITDYEARIDATETLASTANAAALSASSLVSGLQNPAAVTTTYDSQGRVATVTEALPAGNRVTTASYDAGGHVASLVIVFNGTTRTETYTYNTDGQLTGMTATEV